MDITNITDEIKVTEVKAEDPKDLKEGSTVTNRQTKILVAIPCQEMVNVNFVASLLHLQKPAGSGITFTQSSILPQSRDTLADIAISGDYTHILFVDSDMTFPADALHKLFMHNVDICTGLCFARKDIHNPCIYKRINYENPVRGVHNGNIDVEEDIERPFFEVKACGMAFCLIKTQALADIRSRSDGELFRYIDTFGEDLSFCIRALKCGYKIWCDTTIPIGHIGEKEFKKEDWYLAKQIKELREKAAEAEKKIQEKKEQELDSQIKKDIETLDDSCTDNTGKED